MAFKKFVSKAELHFSEEGGTQVYLGDIHGVTIMETSGDKPVDTFEADGIAGFIDGPVQAEISFDSAKPRRGQKKNFRAVMRKHKDVTIIEESGDERTQYDGRIQSINLSYSLEAPSNLQCKVLCSKGQLLQDA